MKLDFESNTATFTPVGSDFLAVKESDNNSANASKMLREGIEAAQNGKTSEARNLLLRVTEADANNEKAWLWLASISEYPEELLVFLNNVLNINPNNERALEWAKATKSLLSKTFVQRGIDASNENDDFAKQCFLQAIVHDNENEMAWLWLASVADAEDEKSSHLQRVLNINPDNGTAKSLLESINQKKRETLFQTAEMFAVKGENETALTALEHYFRQSPEAENAWLLKSFLVQSFEEKLECYEQVLQINSANELAQMNAAYLRSMSEKTEVEEVENEAQMSDPEEVTADESESNFASVFPIFEVETPEEMFVEEAEEEVFASEENQSAEEMQTEIPMPKFELPQYSMPEEEEEFLVTDESDAEDEVFAPQAEFEESQQVEFEQSNAQFEQPQAEFEQPQVEEMQFTESNEVAEVNFEAHTEFSDESEDDADERGYAFYPEVEEKAEAQETYFAESQESFSEKAEEKSDVFSEYESKPEFDENVQEIPQVYAFQQPAEFAAESEVANEQNDLSEAENSEVAEYSMESDSQEAENNAPDVYEIENSETVAENNYSHIFENAENSPEEMQVEAAEAPSYFGEENMPQPQVAMSVCAFCQAENEQQSLVCHSCRAVLTFADLEMVLANHEADKEMVGNAVSQMEAERARRDLNSDELKQMALGYLNLGNSLKGLYFLNEAAKMTPDDIVLSSQVNALKIRLSEIEKQKDVHDSMPKNLTILVVDDSATVRKLISGKLEKSGHEVVCAMDGIDALEKIKEIVPDLVLLDINMPRMDGYQVCKMIRGNEATKDVPVVMISGKDGFFDKVRGRMAGTTGYITKPFGPETLMKTVETYIA